MRIAIMYLHAFGEATGGSVTMPKLSSAVPCMRTTMTRGRRGAGENVRPMW